MHTSLSSYCYTIAAYLAPLPGRISQMTQAHPPRDAHDLYNRAPVAARRFDVNWSIRLRLFAVLALNLGLMIVLGAFAIVQMDRAIDETRSIGEDTIPSLQLIDKLNNTILRYRTAQLRHIINKDSARTSDTENEMKKLEEQMVTYFQEYQPLLSETDEKAAADQLQAQWTGYVTFNHQNLLPLSRAGQADQALNAFDTVKPAYDNLVVAATSLTDYNQSQANETLESGSMAFEVVRLLVLGLTILALLLSAVLGFLLSRAIVRNIRLLMAGTTAVAAGDLDHDVSIGGDDEFSRLAAAFNRMISDLRRQRAAIEQRGDDLQQILDAQRRLFETVRQLSAPVLPVADNVIVLPLVGHIDTRRAQEIMDALLQGVAAERAKFAILDITGVAMLDTHVMGLLLQTMRAVELLGARAMLAGISAEAAQLIVAQGIGLGELHSYRDLRDAIRAALSMPLATTSAGMTRF
jgi:anti-anti-sigma factor